MPVLTEKHIREKVIAHARKLGWTVIVVDYGGWPDRLFISPQGQHVWVEFKSTRGKLAARQGARIRRLISHRVRVHIVRDIDVGTRIIDDYTRMDTTQVPGASHDPDAPAGSGGGSVGSGSRKDSVFISGTQDPQEEGTNQENSGDNSSSPDVLGVADGDQEVG